MPDFTQCFCYTRLDISYKAYSLGEREPFFFVDWLEAFDYVCGEGVVPGVMFGRASWKIGYGRASKHCEKPFCVEQGEPLSSPC
jgi:hypothetical protein